MNNPDHVDAVWLPSNVDRLYQKLGEKIERYEELAERLNISYVVSIFGDIKAVVEPDELQDVLHTAHEKGIFVRFPWLSGVLYFYTSSLNYNFKYFNNPAALRPLCVPDDQL